MPTPSELLSAGCVPRPRPPIRAGSLHSAADPMGYLLREIYCITSAFRADESEALSRGSWTHLAFYSYLKGINERDQQLVERITNIKQRCKEFQVSTESRDQMIADEEVDAKTCYAWIEAANQVRNPIARSHALNQGFITHFSSARYIILGFEVRICIVREDGVLDLATYDVLLYDTEAKGLIALDLKTCSGPATQRLAVCPKEHQTRHYIRLGLDAASCNLFHKKWPDKVPSGSPFLGLKHIALQKPTINLCGEDRPYKIEKKILKSGPRKGMEIDEKVWTSDTPTLELYIARCRRWYLGLEEFTQRQAFILSPDKTPINISTTPSDYYSKADWAKYNWFHSMAVALSKTDPHPDNFPDDVGRFLMYRGDSPYLDFYLTSPAQWPEVMRRKRLIFSPRDPDVDNVKESCIL